MPGQAIVTIRGKQWQVSLATAPWELARGLGGIPGIPAGTGMLFDMGWQQIITVSTQPMVFPLDIAFFSDSMVVTEVYRNITPNYLVTSELPARYFLEVNTGELEGIETGDRAGAELLPLVTAPLQAPNWVQTMFSFMAFAIMAAFIVGVARMVIKTMFDESEKSPLLPSTSRVALPSRAVEIVGVKPKEVVALYQAGFPGIYADDSYYITTDDPAGAKRVIMEELNIPAGRVRELPTMPRLPHTEPRVDLLPQTTEGKTLRFATETRTVTAATFKKWLHQGRARPLQVGGYYGAEGPKPALYIVDDTIYRIDWRSYSHDLLPASKEDLAQRTIQQMKEQGIEFLSRVKPREKTAEWFREEMAQFVAIGKDRIGVVSNVIGGWPGRRVSASIWERDPGSHGGIRLKQERVLPLTDDNLSELVSWVKAECPGEYRWQKYEMPIMHAIRQGWHPAIPKEEASAPIFLPKTIGKESRTEECIKEIAEWFRIHRREIRVKDLEPIVAKHFSTEEEQVRFIKFISSPDGRKRIKEALWQVARPGITEEEWREAEGMWEVTKEDAEKGEVAGVYLWGLLSKYYPDNKNKQIRLTGFMGEVQRKYPGGRIPAEEAWELARKWEVERMLVKELLEFLPQVRRIRESSDDYALGYRHGVSICEHYGTKQARKLAQLKPINRYEEGKKQACIDYLKKRGIQLAVIPTEPRPRRGREELEYLADSPEFLTQTIDATGYRSRLDTTFQEAIARAKGLR